MTFRDKAAAFHETQDRYATAEGWRSEAMKHLGKELSPAYYDIAISRMGPEALVKEAVRQCEDLLAKGIHLRDGNNMINDGLLDLTKLGLTPEEAEACNAERRKQGINNTLITAQAVLGEYLYFQAANKKTSLGIAEEIYNQMEAQRKAGKAVRHSDNTVRQSGYDLTQFGLTPEQVAAREKEAAAYDTQYAKKLEEEATMAFKEANANWAAKVKGGGAEVGQKSHGFERF